MVWSGHQIRRFYMVSAAALAWFALLLQFYLIVVRALALGLSVTSAIVDYFSYFTILTNLLVALALTLPERMPGSTIGVFFGRPVIKSGIAVYIAIVGVVYSVLLRHSWNPEGMQKLADTLLHDFIPLLYVVYWLMFVPKKDLRWKHAVQWLVYPLIYATYSLVRGALSGRYLYPFIDAAAIGYMRTLVNAVILCCAFLITGLVIVAIGRMMQEAKNQDIAIGRRSSGPPVAGN
jgi:hypothetical protein